MPVGYFNLQWLNHNAVRSYPLTAWATKRDLSDAITIPDSFIVALRFPIHAGLDVEPDRFFIRQLTIFPSGYNVAIGYDDDSDNPPLVAAVNIAKSTHTENREYALAGSDDYSDSVGRIVIGRLNEIDELPPGQYLFDRDGAALEVDAIPPMIRGLQSLTVVNGFDRSSPIFGDVELVSGTNVSLSVNRVSGEDPQIVFNAISGEGLNNDCLCEDENAGVPIQMIDGVVPTADGRFTLLGDDCIEITPITNGLKLSDRCSQPCCGCEALDSIVQRIDRFADGKATLDTFVRDLRAQVSQFHSVILGSRLGDQGCVDC